MGKTKPQNWERDLQTPNIHNPPESFYFRFRNIVIYTDGLLEPPTVLTHKVARVETADKVKEWLDRCNIPYDLQKVEPIVKVERYPEKGMDDKTLQWFQKYSTFYENGIFIIKTISSPGRSELFKWLDIIRPVAHVFDLSQGRRKELFSIYRETMIAKLTEAIESIDKAISNIWNENTRLPIPYNILNRINNDYKISLKEFKKTHRRTGEHKFLYPLIKPLVEKFHEIGISNYRLMGYSKEPSPLIILFEIFGYGSFGDEDQKDARSILKYIRNQ